MRIHQPRSYFYPQYVRYRNHILGTEYVGRVINAEGWKFSDEKKAEVLNFRVPRRLGELKSFIGLCEYFHSHIRHFAEIMKPLQEALQGYQKKFRHTRLILNEVQQAAFKKIQEEIVNSALLYYVDEKAPVYLQTDASDYGIGVYLFQRVRFTIKRTSKKSYACNNTRRNVI